MLTCLEQSLPRLNPHREQPTGQSGLGDRWRVPAAQNEEQEALQAGASIFFPKDSLREEARACLAAQGAGAGLWKAKATCCINRRPVPASWLMQILSAGTPGTVTSISSWSCLLRAQLQPHNIHPVPSAPAQASPWGCSLLSQPLCCPIPKAMQGAGETWRLSGSRGSPASPHGLNLSFSHSSEASPHPAIPYSNVDTVHGPTGSKTQPKKPRCGVQIPQTTEILRTDLRGEGCAWFLKELGPLS